MKLSLFAWAAGAACAAGCLSIDVVPRGTGDAGEQPDASHPIAKPDVGSDAGRDGGEPDGDLPDGELPDVDVPPPRPGSLGGACTSLNLPAGVAQRALRCDDPLACYQGTCRELQACAAGRDGPCGIVIPTPLAQRGGDWASGPDAFYWVALGALDARGNYDGQGAIMRLRFSDWTVETMAGGLDFFDEPTRQFDDVQLTVKDGHVVWRSGTGTYALPESRPGAAPVVMLDYATSWCFRGDVGYRISTRRAFRRDVLPGVDSAETVIASGASIAGGPCFVDGHSLIGANGVSIALNEDGSASLRNDELEPEVLYADDGQVITVLADGYIGRRTRGADGTLGPVVALGGPADVLQGVQDGFVYWRVRDASYCNQWVVRTRIDGADEPEAISWRGGSCYGFGPELMARSAFLATPSNSLPDFDLVYLPFEETAP